MAKQQDATSAVNVSFNIPTVDGVRYCPLHGYLGTVTLTEITQLTQLSIPFTLQDMRDACLGYQVKHLMKVVGYLAKYNDPSNTEDEACRRVAMMVTALHGSFEARVRKHRVAGNNGLANQDQKKVELLESLLLGTYEWERQSKSATATAAPVQTFGQSNVDSLRARLLGKKAPKAEPEAPKVAEDAPKAEESAPEIAELQKEIGKLEFAMGFATKANKQKMEKQLAELKAKLADMS